MYYAVYIQPRMRDTAYSTNEKEACVSSTAEETGAVAQDGTGAGLIAFLNWTIAKNELVDATASALRTGCQKVLSIEDDPNGVDLRAVDIDGIITRFRNKHRLDMKDRTLEQYEQRFRQSLDMYLKWLDNDPAWKPAQRKRSPSSNSTGSSSRGPKENARPQTPSVQQQVEQHQQPGIIKYPFPIRPGLQGSITLPEDLSMREAKRIAAFVSTLAMEDEPITDPPRAIQSSHFHEEE